MFLEKPYTKCGRETIPRPFSKKSKLYLFLDQYSKVLYVLFSLFAKLKTIVVFLATASIITSMFQNLYFNIKLHNSTLFLVCSVNVVLTLTTFEIVLLWHCGVEISVTLSFSTVPSCGVFGHFRWKSTDVSLCIVCFTFMLWSEITKHTPHANFLT